MILAPQPEGIPVPRPSPMLEPYWAACRAGSLTFQRCRSCAGVNAKAGPVCSRCWSSDLEWQASGGTGSLYSWTVVWRPQHPSFRIPYAPAIVQLDEGVPVLTSIIGCSVPDLRADLRVRVEFHPVSDEIWLPYFTPSGT